MHPAHDKELRAIVGESPGEGYVFCDECLRWENLDNMGHAWIEIGDHSWLANILYWISGCLFWLASKIRRRANLIQAQHLVDSGQGVSEGH